ncbi:N-acetylmuramoyl-L-alanine amidase family protein [Stakelama saccharophila]|uniref:N-acetylmuramoyl-L-alanine amidase n=1 Tax=Stakelama saccharophila TaxID=3075605 RepID=A0ABZ0BB00_9SPHN|nr:N-acetylmuramoyl-L-alanine amidase [Stakelama sp. W311]WNO54235.1 N-acetylmuramoyl-L-alanine amidase [Stakelama sp. W311]
MRGNTGGGVGGGKALPDARQIPAAVPTAPLDRASKAGLPGEPRWRATGPFIMLFGWTGKVARRHSVGVGFLLLILASWMGGAPAWTSAVEDIRIAPDRIVIRFDGRVADARSFLRSGAERTVADGGGASSGVASHTAGVTARVRRVVHGPDSARIVFDLSRPAIVTGGSFGADGRTLTLSLRNVGDADFHHAVARGRAHSLPDFAFGHRRSAPSITMDVPPVRDDGSLPRIYGAAAGRPLVVIDAGHGGHDPGAIGVDGLREKNVTLKIAEAIKAELIRSGRVRVALTRESDRFLPLRRRYAIARRLHAGLFLSIHCDSAANPDATGATAYTLSEVASDKEAARLAARENKADVIAGVDLDRQSADISSILIDLTQRQTMNASAGFARLLGREAEPLIRTKDDFHRMASLMVLKAPDMPSILFEAGYISNEDDAAMLASAAGRKHIARAIREAVDIHFARQLASR